MAIVCQIIDMTNRPISVSILIRYLWAVTQHVSNYPHYAQPHPHATLLRGVKVKGLSPPAFEAVRRRGHKRLPTHPSLQPHTRV